MDHPSPWNCVRNIEVDTLHRLVLVVGDGSVLGPICNRHRIYVAFCNIPWYSVFDLQNLIKMKKTSKKSKVVVFSADVKKMMQKAEKNPRQGSCPVVDVLEDLMAMGYKEWVKRNHPHKRQKPNK